MEKVVITIPAYNEEETIGAVIEEINTIMPNTNYKYELLVLNDGSTDKTAEIAKNAGAKVVSHKVNRGLAATFLSEMEECKKLNADIIVHTDADGQYPAKYIPELISKIQEGHDLVLGSRFNRSMHAKSLVKDVTNRIFASVLGSMLKYKITDSTTGFRAFTMRVAELPLINSFTYTQEQLIRAAKAKLKIAEISIEPRKTRPSRLFKGTLNYAIRAWVNIFRVYRDYKPIKFFGIFGLAFILIGFFIGLKLLYDSIITTLPGFWDLHVPTLVLIAIFVIAGLQLIFFGLLADMINANNKK